MATYIRFVVGIRDERSGHRKGIFAALGALRKHPDLTDIDYAQYRVLADWFNDNLEHPHRFSRSSRPHAKAKALSWFKDTAEEFVSKSREISELLNRYGIEVTMIKSTRPGYIVYESPTQIVAEPFSDTVT